MKKVSLCLLCLVWAISSCEIPQSLTIKGNPGLAISIGSPFSDGNRLEDYLDLNEIRKMMGGDGDSSINVYDYVEDPASDDGIQVFLIHYPIADLELDLSEYKIDTMHNAQSTSYTIPSGLFDSIDDSAFLPGGFYEKGLFLTGTGVPAAEESGHLFTISFGDMTKLIKEVNGTFGLKVSDYDSSFENNLFIRIPEFGITKYIKGDATQVPGELWFFNDGFDTFYPEDEIEVYVKLKGVCSGTITPELIFDWTEATVDTSDMGGEALTGSYDIDNSLGEYFGGSITFSDIKGYIYVYGLDEKTDAEITLKIDNTALVNNDALTAAERLNFPADTSQTMTGALPKQSLSDAIDLDKLLNGTSSTLSYEIKINQMVIYAYEIEAGMKCSVDFVIVLPLALTVSTPLDIGTDVFADAGEYVKLDMGAIFDLGLGDDGSDLFGRESDDDLLSNLSLVKITLKDFKNDLIKADMGILLTAPYPDGISYYSDLMLFDDNQSLEISDIKGLNPFIPSFEIVLKKDENKKYATFGIKRPSKPNPTFDFSLTVEVQAEINHTIPLD